GSPANHFSAAFRTRSSRRAQPLSIPVLYSSGISPRALCLKAIRVPPSTGVRRYCRFETAAKDMKSGPVISSRVGRLMAWTCPHRCPLSLPRSRYQRPPGRASIFMGIGPFSVSLRGPISSSSAANVASGGALTRISWVMFRVSSLAVDAGRTMGSSFDGWVPLVGGWLRPLPIPIPGLVRSIAVPARRSAGRFSAFLDPAELLSPETLERGGPLVHGSDRVRVRAVQHPSAVAARPHEIDLAQDPQMFRDRRLGQSQRRHDLADRTLLPRQEVEDGPALGLRDGVEDVRGSGEAGHEHIIFHFGHMS